MTLIIMITLNDPNITRLYTSVGKQERDKLKRKKRGKTGSNNPDNLNSPNNPSSPMYRQLQHRLHPGHIIITTRTAIVTRITLSDKPVLSVKP